LGIFGLYVLMATSVGKLGSGTKNPPSFKRGSVKISPIWHMPSRNDRSFTGREKELQRLAEELKASRKVALTGVAGIGKTQIALEYAYRHRGSYPIVLWINAATETTLITSFVTIAETYPSLGVKNGPDQRKVVEAIKCRLDQSDTCWLLIFDNADDITLVQNFLPRSDKGSIVLTTRAQAVRSIAEPIEVGKMAWEEGKDLLLRRAYGCKQDLDISENEVRDIVSTLEYFPLALDQAGAYIEENICSLSDYFKLYDRDRKELLARRGNQSSNSLTLLRRLGHFPLRRSERQTRQPSSFYISAPFLLPMLSQKN
jgi:NB-ARC domain